MDRREKIAMGRVYTLHFKQISVGATAVEQRVYFERGDGGLYAEYVQSLGWDGISSSLAKTVAELAPVPLARHSSGLTSFCAGCFCFRSAYHMYIS